MLEVIVVDRVCDGVPLTLGLGLGLPDCDPDTESAVADTLLVPVKDDDATALAAVGVPLRLLVVLVLVDAVLVIDGEPDGTSLEVIVVDRVCDGVPLTLGLASGLGLPDCDPDTEPDTEPVGTDTLLVPVEDDDATALAAVGVTEGGGSLALTETLPDCDVDGAAEREGDVLKLGLGVVVAVSDGDGDAEAHTLDPAMLDVPDGHTAWVDDVDPGPQ